MDLHPDLNQPRLDNLLGLNLNALKVHFVILNFINYCGDAHIVLETLCNEQFAE